MLSIFEVHIPEKPEGCRPSEKVPIKIILYSSSLGVLGGFLISISLRENAEIFLLFVFFIKNLESG